MKSKQEKMIQIRYIFIVIMLLGSFSCNSLNSKDRKPVSKISITTSEQSLNYNSDFSIEVESISKNGKIDSVYVYLGSELLMATNSEKISIKVDKNKYIGNQTIKVISKTNKGIEGKSFKSFFIASDITPKPMKFEIEEKYNHDTKRFTQGFEFNNGKLYEGTGEYGMSAIYSYDVKTEKLYSNKNIDDQYFGEGITIIDNKLFQITYKNKKGFVWDVKTLELVREFGYASSEGWGLTNNGKELIMSDGTSFITFLDPNTFSITRKIEVIDDKQSIANINELEYVDGYIYANIWQTNYIIKIEESSGKVISVANLSDFESIAKMKYYNIDVLNGIAYNKEEDSFYLTGKFWPYIFKTKLKE